MFQLPSQFLASGFGYPLSPECSSPAFSGCVPTPIEVEWKVAIREQKSVTSFTPRLMQSLCNKNGGLEKLAGGQAALQPEYCCF